MQSVEKQSLNLSLGCLCSHRFWSESNRNPDSFVPVGKLAICPGRLATDKRIFATQKIKQGLRLVLCEIAYSMSIHSSQCTFHGFIKDIFRKRNVRCCELDERNRTYRGRVFSQQFLTRHMQTCQTKEEQI